MISSGNENSAQLVEIAKGVISLIATVIGLVVIVIGLKYAMDIFQLIFTIMESPAALSEPLQQMAESIGGKAFDLELRDRSIPLANLMALAVYCGGALLSAWLTFALMQTGAKIVSLTAGDRSAVKKLLQSAFGSRMRPETAKQRPAGETVRASRIAAGPSATSRNQR